MRSTLNSTSPPGSPGGLGVSELPIHFFTIVLNGEPYIRHHMNEFKKLTCRWHWHIVEGVAALRHDTAWSLGNGGRIPNAHCRGRSVDGTSEYLDELAREFPDHVTLYRLEPEQFWDGKRAMVSVPLGNIREECLLWEIDADEIWTAGQFERGRALFLEHPEKTAARYWCWFFVGPNLVTITRDGYANSRSEWLRTWRYRPGMAWAQHEPPVLAEPIGNDVWRDVAAIDPFTQTQTEEAGLVFQHYAYAMIQQLQFKEQYYGYRDAVAHWRRMQRAPAFPVRLGDYFQWVMDQTMVDQAEGRVTPLLQIPVAPEMPAAPTIVVDGIFFQMLNTGIARVWRSILTQWAKTGMARHVVVVDRAGSAPRIPGIQYVPATLFYPERLDADRILLQQICDQFGASVFISTYYTLPLATPTAMLMYDMIPEVRGYDFSNPWWQCKHLCIRQARAFLSISRNTTADLCRFFPQIRPESVVTVHPGVNESFVPSGPEVIARFRSKYGLTRPYFLTVGFRTEYKGVVSVFEAFHRLTNQDEFDIVCVGGLPGLEEGIAACAPNARVHMLQLPDEEMASVYSGATALCYPSAYEGFGLPIAEAMACGCPVITCRNSSIPEVAGEAVLYVNPHDPVGLAEAMTQVQKAATRARLMEAGFKQVKGFTWEKMARVMAQTLFSVAAVSVSTARPAARPSGTQMLNATPGGLYVISPGEL